MNVIRYSQCYMSTVFALSSGYGKCGVAVIRITGPDAKYAIQNMTQSKNRKIPPPRKAVLRTIINPKTNEKLDHGLVFWFPKPHSFTGEDCVELQTHGGPAVVKAVLDGLGTLPNFSPAQPGDFTKRAFYNEKLDLTSVEGLGDLIHAETESQRKQAFRQMEGALSELYTKWRNLIIESRATVEAYIDFSEDDMIHEGVLDSVRKNVIELRSEIEFHLRDGRKGERIRNGIHMVIIGKPNVGKSTLLNTLVQRPAAIVSPIAGTTRDIIETNLDLGGYPVIVKDTAGLHYTEDFVEKEGVSRAINAAENADMAIIMIDADDVLNSIKNNKQFEWNMFINDHLSKLGLNKNITWFLDKSYMVIINKIDLIKKDDIKLLNTLNECNMLSLKTESGVECFMSSLVNICSELCENNSPESPTLTAARHRTHVTNCLNYLNIVLGKTDKNIYEQQKNVDLLSSDSSVITAAFYLNSAANELGYVTGRITTEDVLDKIFSSFCIGK